MPRLPESENTREAAEEFFRDLERSQDELDDRKES